MQEVEEVNSIGDRIEVTAVSTKTSRGNDRLPILLVGPKAIVTVRDWFESLINFRSEINAPYPEFPLVPSLGEDGWMKKQTRLQDFNDGIRLVLSQVGFAKARVASSQGMKAMGMQFWDLRVFDNCAGVPRGKMPEQRSKGVFKG